MATATASVELPLSVEQAWAVLSDTPRMIALDPLLEAYEPEHGTLREGTLNRVTSRLGPWRMVMTTRTEVLDPPHRAVFVSVAPARPVRARTEDTLEPSPDGCRYTVVVTVKPTLPAVGHIAAFVAAAMMGRSRRRFMDRLHATVSKGV
jgi:hypothetical protein